MSMTNRRHRGLFINFEGGDGSGKTTQLPLLATHLKAEGFHAVEATEPGGTRIGNQIRQILLDNKNQELCATAEMLLYFASRAQNVEEVILPALDRGDVVLVDRFTDSTMAYQGFGRGLGEEAVVQLDRIACRGLKPDLTILFDIDLESSMARARQRHLDRMDAQAVEFHHRVRQAYLKMAEREPDRFRVVDGRATVEIVALDVWNAISPVLSTLHV